MRYHITALMIGFILDLILGDPYCFPHPIRLIGRLIGKLEQQWNGKESKKALRNGGFLVMTVTGSTVLLSGAILFAAYWIHWAAGLVVESIMTYQILATKCLKTESMKVYHCLKQEDIPGARKAVSMIVGRDTENLDEIGITKAAVETVAENTSDGVIAPMIYTALGGPVLGFWYKAINTMDSMVGYKNDRYLYFGRCAAKLDDVVNYIPARMSAYFMMAACIFLGKDFSVRESYRIHKRDCRKHASPNSAQTESTCAGALGIRLAGNAVYFGEVHEKPYIGDETRPIHPEDIRKANRLLYTTAILCMTGCVIVLLAVSLGIR